MTLSVGAIAGGFQAGMVFALKVSAPQRQTIYKDIDRHPFLGKSSTQNGTVDQQGLRFFGIFSSIVISVALL